MTDLGVVFFVFLCLELMELLGYWVESCHQVWENLGHCFLVCFPGPPLRDSSCLVSGIWKHLTPH